MDFCQLLREERQRAREAAQPKSPIIVETEKPTKDEVSSLWQDASLEVWTKRLKIDIEKFVKGSIPSVYYIPDWITKDEEDAILERVYAVSNKNDKWVNLKHRRLQMWGGEVKTPFNPEPLPQWLMQISHTLVDMGVFTEEMKPNHALINEYGVGNSIMPHQDGPAYFPLVAIISTGAECRVTFERHREADTLTELQPAIQNNDVRHFDFQLKRRSLLLFTGEAYTRYLHSIDNVEVGTRISLTIRHVISTSLD
ncbi:unnamed protein product [Peronospora destructor]|uniref:Fe2OG dioxygenase domain-containing protein n=1 Tax=Peronospora destructor TaxID=86335 RepID=A0AAV0THM8_9STRA|nr:unnamed protein product [Peronospora destructor]